MLPVHEPLPTNDDDLHRACLVAPNLTMRRVALALAVEKRPGSREKQRLYRAASECLAAMAKVVDDDETSLRQLVSRAVHDLQGSTMFGADLKSSCLSLLLALSRHRADDVMRNLSDACWRSNNALPDGDVLAVMTAVVRERALALPKAQLVQAFQRIAPLLARVQSPEMRCAVCVFVAALCDAALEQVLAGSAAASDFEVDTSACYEIVAGRWLVGSEAAVRSAAAHALGSICKVLPRARFLADVANALPRVLRAVERRRAPLPAMAGLAWLLMRCVKEGVAAGQLAGHDVLAVLQCSVELCRAHAGDRRVRHEAERCAEHLAFFETDAVLSYLSAHCEGDAPTLDMWRRCCACVPDAVFNDARKAIVVMGVKDLLRRRRDKGFERVAGVAVLNLISCMIQRGMLLIEGGQEVADWVLFDALAQPHLHEAAAELLFLCSRSCASLCCPLLWPHGLNVVVEPRAIDAVGPVCEALTAMVQHLEGVHSLYVFDWASYPNLVPMHDAICALFVLLGEYEAPASRSRAIAELLVALAFHLHPGLSVATGGTDAFRSALEKLLACVARSAVQRGPEHRDEWLRLVSALVQAAVDAVDDDMWRAALGQSYTRLCNTLFAGNAMLRWICVEELRLVSPELANHHFGPPAIPPDLQPFADLPVADDDGAEAEMQASAM